MAREITIVTPENVELKFELAGLGSRFVAMVLDTLLQTLIIVVPVILIWGVAFGWSSLLNTPNMPAWMIAIGILLVFSVWNGYFLYWEAVYNGQTPGKKSAGIRVILDTGHPVDFRAALLRNILRAVDSFPGVYGVGFISIFLTRDYRRLGDYVAGTLVVKTRRKPEKSAAAAQPSTPPKTDLQPVPPEQNESPREGPGLPLEALPYLSEISRDDYRAVRHFLNRRPELQDSVALDLARKLAEPMAAKLRVEADVLDDPIGFLDCIGREWERRMIH